MNKLEADSRFIPSGFYLARYDRFFKVFLRQFYSFNLLGREIMAHKLPACLPACLLVGGLINCDYSVAQNLQQVAIPQGGEAKWGEGTGLFNANKLLQYMRLII